MRSLTKKAQGTFGIFYFMIGVFLFVVFSAGLIWVMGTLNNVFTQVGVINEQTPHPTYYFPCADNSSATCSMNTYTNMSLASEQIWGSAYDSIQALRMVSVVYILALGVCIIITGFLERKHPFLFFVYVLIVLLAVIFAPTISNSYEALLDSNIFDGELQNFTVANFLILNLPLVVLIIGALSSIGLFINLIRMNDERGL
jgi:hypothetical protein